jgi:hypothetical protein
MKIRFSSRSLFACFSLILFGWSASFAFAQNTMPLPQNWGFASGDTYGFWFTAPKDFAILGLEVPSGGYEGTQFFMVVKLPSPPPEYREVSNDFEILFLTQNNPAVGKIPVYIPITTGDIIGVFGEQGNFASLGSNGFVSEIDGLPVVLNPILLRQDPLEPLQNYTSNSFIGRIEVSYGPLKVDVSNDPPIAAPKATARKPSRRVRQKRPRAGELGRTHHNQKYRSPRWISSTAHGIKFTQRPPTSASPPR